MRLMQAPVLANVALETRAAPLVSNASQQSKPNAAAGAKPALPDDFFASEQPAKVRPGSGSAHLCEPGCLLAGGMANRLHLHRAFLASEHQEALSVPVPVCASKSQSDTVLRHSRPSTTARCKPLHISPSVEAGHTGNSTGIRPGCYLGRCGRGAVSRYRSRPHRCAAHRFLPRQSCRCQGPWGKNPGREGQVSCLCRE